MRRTLSFLREASLSGAGTSSDCAAGSIAVEKHRKLIGEAPIGIHLLSAASRFECATAFESRIDRWPSLSGLPALYARLGLSKKRN